jgi:hypothetical protein
MKAYKTKMGNWMLLTRTTALTTVSTTMDTYMHAYALVITVVTVNLLLLLEANERFLSSTKHLGTHTEMPLRSSLLQSVELERSFLGDHDDRGRTGRILIQTLLPLLEISPCCATQCTALFTKCCMNCRLFG